MKWVTDGLFWLVKGDKTMACSNIKKAALIILMVIPPCAARAESWGAAGGFSEGLTQGLNTMNNMRCSQTPGCVMSAPPDRRYQDQLDQLQRDQDQLDHQFQQLEQDMRRWRFERDMR